jgi:hypothetical protein
MKVKVKPTAGGAVLEVELAGGADTTVGDAKRAIAEQHAGAEDVRLIYRGQILKDERTVGSYGAWG